MAKMWRPVHGEDVPPPEVLKDVICDLFNRSIPGGKGAVMDGGRVVTDFLGGTTLLSTSVEYPSIPYTTPAN